MHSLSFDSSWLFMFLCIWDSRYTYKWNWTCKQGLQLDLKEKKKKNSSSFRSKYFFMNNVDGFQTTLSARRWSIPINYCFALAHLQADNIHLQGGAPVPLEVLHGEIFQQVWGRGGTKSPARRHILFYSCYTVQMTEWLLTHITVTGKRSITTFSKVK